MAARLDLTGRWDGTYRYSNNFGPETPFVAVLSEVGERFSGEIIEPNAYRPVTAHAQVEGLRSGRAIEFTKTYRLAGPVDYSGRMSEDGQSITGTWFLPEFDGTFEMHREASETVPQESEAAEKVSLTR